MVVQPVLLWGLRLQHYNAAEVTVGSGEGAKGLLREPDPLDGVLGCYLEEGMQDFAYF